jgi:23S rRNA pseudouridine2457 synthase
VPFRYLLFNKPFQVLSQFTPGSTPRKGEPARRTLADFLRVPNVYPAGRLDYDSEGLMLLTDDGALQHRLSNPGFAHPRTYWVQVEGVVTAEALEHLARGIVLEGIKTRAAKSRRLDDPNVPPRMPPIRIRKSIPTSWLELTIAEGRNRQVRRMTAATGFPTLRLIRVRIGDLTLAGLAPGEWRDLTRAELDGIETRSGL